MCSCEGRSPVFLTQLLDFPVAKTLGSCLRTSASEQKPARAQMKAGYVYMMASRLNGTLYLGCTSDLIQRAYQHRNRLADGFSRRHGCTLLVWFECHDDLQDARLRELQLKKWKRGWKLKLIEHENPDWLDLYPTLFG